MLMTVRIIYEFGESETNYYHCLHGKYHVRDYYPSLHELKTTLMTRELFDKLIIGWIGIGAIIFIVLLFVSAPYGRHTRKGWGPVIPNRLGWVMMELPSMLFFGFFFLRGPGGHSFVTWIFFAIWIIHYTNRSLIYPFRTRTVGKEMPLMIALFAIFFNFINGTTNGVYFSEFSRDYNNEWLLDARFITGALVLVIGVIINLRSDRHLLSLRKSASNGYQIPRGGMFTYVSCPNFLGEILEWTGFAIMTWSPAALGFALWTFFNLVPRALEHHKWYKDNFEDYPESRKAIIPYVL